MKTIGRVISIIVSAALLLTVSAGTALSGNAATYTNLQAGDFEGYYGTPVQEADGVKVVTNATYKTALEPEYICATIRINAFGDGGWIAAGFQSGVANIDDAQSVTKLRFMLKKDGDRLNIEGFKGADWNSGILDNRTLENVDILGDLTLVFSKNNDSGKWSLLVNGEDLGELEGVTADDFCSGDGKTYLGFASFIDTAGDREAALNYTVKSVSTDRPLPPAWAADWQNYYMDLESVDGGVKIITNATYKTALDASYITYKLDIGSLLEGAWIAAGFQSGIADIDSGASTAKLRFMLKNSDGKLNIEGFKGADWNNKILEGRTLDAVDAVGEITLTLSRSADGGRWSLLVNGEDLGELEGVTAGDFCDASGRTYLGFASWTPEPFAQSREQDLFYTVTDISTTRPSVPEPAPSEPWKDDWQAYYWDIAKEGDGVRIVTDATYKKPLNPDYMEFTVHIGALNDKGWIMFGFQDSVADIGSTDPANGAVSARRLQFYMRSNEGKLNIFAENLTKGQNLANFLDFGSIDAVGTDITVVFEKSDNGGWTISFNGAKMLDASGNMAKIEASDFCNDEGKTYLGFASWTEVPSGAERENTLFYTVKSIVNEKENTTVTQPSYLPGAQISDYTAPWGGEQGEDYAQFHADAQYNTPLSPTYIRSEFSIEKLTPIAYDSQFNAMIIIALNNKEGIPNPDDPTKLDQLPGLAILLRNLNGKLLIDINGYGAGVRGGTTAWTFVRRQTAIPAIGRHTLEIKKAGTRYDIYLDGALISDGSVEMPDKLMLNSDGKTYVSFLGRDDATKDSTEQRVWRVYEISNSKGNPSTGAEGALPTCLAMILVSGLALTAAAKRKKQRDI